MQQTLTDSSWEWSLDTGWSLSAAESACHHLGCKICIRVHASHGLFRAAAVLGFALVLHILWDANHHQGSSSSNAIHPQLKIYGEDLHCPKNKHSALHFVAFGVTSTFSYDPTQLYLVMWMTRCLEVEKVIFVECKLQHFTALQKEQTGGFICIWRKAKAKILTLKTCVTSLLHTRQY